jgi:hypothetical protein
MGDLLGDWREEVLIPSPDGRALRLYTTRRPRCHTHPRLATSFANGRRPARSRAGPRDCGRRCLFDHRAARTHTARQRHEACPISYESAPGAKPVISGGRIDHRLQARRQRDLETKIPGSSCGHLVLRAVDRRRRRAVRAKTPNRFYDYMGDTSEVPVEGKPGQFRRTTEVRPSLWNRSRAQRPNFRTSRSSPSTNGVSAAGSCRDRPDANTIITIGEKLKSYSGWPVNTRFHLENFKAASTHPASGSSAARDALLHAASRAGHDEGPSRRSRC